MIGVSRVRRVVLPLVLTAVVGTLITVVVVSSAPQEPLIGRMAPALSGTDLDAEQRELEQLRGDVVLVNIWASWCSPCRDEIPALVEAEQRYADAGLRVLGVNTRDRLSHARRAAAEWGADAYPSIHDEEGRIAVSWGAVGVPETFVVDRDGTIVARHFGPVTADWVADTIDGLVSP